MPIAIIAFVSVLLTGIVLAETQKTYDTSLEIVPVEQATDDQETPATDDAADAAEDATEKCECDSAPKRPAYSMPLRHPENWSALRDPSLADDGDLFDPIKYIPLSDDESVWVSFGGSTRARYEHWENFGFGNRNDDGFLLSRLLLHGDLHVGEHVRVFAEGKGAYSTERDLPGGRRTLDVDELALQQLFGDLILPIDDWKLTLRGGRQMLLLGKQRLVSPLIWSNTMRTWDGATMILESGGTKITAFWTQFAPVRKYDFNNGDRQTQFYGVYATTPLDPEMLKLDLYFLGLDRDDPVTFNGTTGDEERFTLGGRVHGKCPTCGIDYDLEGAYQFGTVGSGDVDAFMIASQLGYTFADFHGAPRLFIGFDYASGDKAAGGDVETFNQLFPLGHAYYGFIDVVGRQNAVDLSLGVTLKPLANVDGLDKLTLGVTGHLFWRAEDADAFYNAGGGVVRGGGTGSADFIGSEIDVTVTLPIDAHTTVSAGYSHFFAEEFIHESTPGADSDIDFAYIQVEYKF